VNADDVGFLSKLIDEMKERYNVGAVWSLGSPTAACSPTWPVSSSRIGSTPSPVAATIGQPIIEMRPRRPLGSSSSTAWRPRPPSAAPRTGAFFREPRGRALDKVNGCIEAPEKEERDGIELTRYPCPGAEVLYYRIRDAGHVWPGSRVRMRSERDPGSMNASEVIWEFFSSRLC
jgi:poly(3-hydroxybutyrate) depolymerase